MTTNKLASVANIDSLDDFVGQETAKETLAIMIASADRREDRLPHLMLASGYAGVGKTTLARLIAVEMQVDFHIIDPTAKPDAMLEVVERARPRSIIFIDEIHRGVATSRNRLDFLLEPLENGIWHTDEGPQEIPNVTFIAATTDVGKLPEALRSRFDEIQLERPAESVAIEVSLNIAAGILTDHMPLPDLHGSCAAVARAANGNPRRMRKLWESIRDGYLYDADAHHDGEDYIVAPVLARRGLTADGLDKTAIRYLALMSTPSFKTGAGAKKIADALGEPAGVAATEKLLLDKSYLMFSGSGRKLTKLGRDYVYEYLAEGVLAA